MMDNDRLNHSLAVARKMVEIARSQNLSEEEIRNCFIIGFNHDIGYEFTTGGIDHGAIGGKILKEAGFKFWKEITYHGMVDTGYDSVYMRILNQADMQIDKYGNDVGYQKRLDDIKSRYGEDSDIYRICYRLIEEIK